jgi:hypothetical protein
MKKAFGLVLVAGISMGVQSWADGFRCQGLTYKQMLMVYNNTNPKLGTRVAAIMIAADPKIKGPRKTIATFSQVQGLLGSRGTQYIANVDSRFSTISRGGENIAGTKLGLLKAIQLSVDFSYRYNTPSYSGEKYSATVNYVKENGEIKTENMVCIRYIKSGKDSI